MRRTSLIAYCTMACVTLSAAARVATAADSEWPVYRHDARQSGVSLAKGDIQDPRVLWEHYLGTPRTPLATNHLSRPANTADLDGDGALELFSLADRTITVTDEAGDELWSFTVDGRPLGNIVRVRSVLPDQRGQQIVVFSSRMDTGEGQGYCFSFHRGADSGELAWTTGPLDGQHAPTLVIDDVDADGLLDIVSAPHYRVQIFSGQTGELKAEVPWEVGRNYGILLTRPRPDAPQKDIYIVCDFVLHVDCIRYVDGDWIHAWGHKYFEPNSPRPKGRQSYIRVGPNPVTDLNADGADEMAYMLVEAAKEDQWRLRVRAGETGEVLADILGIWLWSIADLDGDGLAEIIYTPTDRKRPPTYCDLHIGRLKGDALVDIAVIRSVRPLVMNAALPAAAHTIADEGQLDILLADIDGNGRPEIFYTRQAADKPFEDAVYGCSLGRQGTLQPRFRFRRPGHRLDVVHAGPGADGAHHVRIRDLTTASVVTVDAAGRAVAEEPLGRPGGFQTTPIIVDLDGDGANEIVVQTASQEIVALQPGAEVDAPPTVPWSVPGVAMNHQPGYAWNGALCPQAADLDGDGPPEVLFAAEDPAGESALVCVNHSGREIWRRAFDGCPWGGLQAGVNMWTFGRFAGRDSGLDVYVDIHRRAKASSEGWALRGDTGEVIWHREGIESDAAAMPFGAGLPGIADLNDDAIDDLVIAFWTIYAAVSGDFGEPIHPPVSMNSPEAFGQWIAYSSPSIADLNGDGTLDVYLDSPSYARGGYAAVADDGKPLWVEFHDNSEGSDGFGPVGDFDGDGAVEIAVPVLNGSMLCLNAADGSHKWRIDANVTLDVAGADINSDGIIEIVFAERDGTLRAVSGRDGADIWSIKLPTPGRPVIGDVNADGLVEVIVVGYDGVLRVVGAD